MSSEKLEAARKAAEVSRKEYGEHPLLIELINDLYKEISNLKNIIGEHFASDDHPICSK